MSGIAQAIRWKTMGDEPANQPGGPAPQRIAQRGEQEQCCWGMKILDKQRDKKRFGTARGEGRRDKGAEEQSPATPFL